MQTGVQWTGNRVVVCIFTLTSNIELIIILFIVLLSLLLWMRQKRNVWMAASAVARTCKGITCGAHRITLSSELSASAFLQVLWVELRFSGLEGKHFYQLSYFISSNNANFM